MSKRPDGMTSVYFIRCGAFVKIGISRDPAKRLANIRTANPGPVRLLGAVPCRDAWIVELRLHEEARPHHVRGEWFRLSKAQADELLARTERRGLHTR